jgi:hypothetical protein
VVAVGARVSVVAELLPGTLLLTLSVMVGLRYGVPPSPLPTLASLLPLLTASIAARRTLPRALRRLYSWRYFDAVSPLLLVPPLLLLLQVGYEYYRLWYAYTVLNLVVSLSTGLAVFLLVYPVLRRL